LSACQARESVDDGVLLFMILLFWVVVDVILAVVYLVNRRR
jgi:heme/copper-type cytochrome/quinol oxidase subunit 2